MPRKIFHGRPYRVIGVAVDYDVYLILKEIAYRKNILLSDLLREIIYDYLKRHGLVKAKAVAQNGGLNTLRALDTEVTIMEIRELNEQLKKLIAKMKDGIPGSQSWLEAKYTGLKIVKKLNALIQKAGIIDDKNVKEAIQNIHKFKELTTPEK